MSDPATGGVPGALDSLSGAGNEAVSSGYSLTQEFNAITDSISGDATNIAQSAVADINGILDDIKGDGTVGSANILNAGGVGIAAAYGVNNVNGLKITEASGAMVIDDLMQKISTKVQVAAQLLSTANNITKTVSRIISQG